MQISTMNLMRQIAGVTLGCALSASTLANNGFYLTGYGFESSMMGGSDVAVARDAFAANNNPAGMSRIAGQSAELEISVFTNPESTHTDSFGNHRKPRTHGDNGFASMAYARHIEGTPYAAGVGLVVQGGLGWSYRGLNTRFGTRDDAASIFTVIKFSPAFAWKISDQLSVGGALGVNYMAGDQELFPNTSVSPAAFPPAGFAGIRFKGANGIGLNSKWGLQYRPRDDITVGVTYGTKTSIPLKDGELRINFSDPGLGGLGVVRYDNAKLTGLRLPEEMAVGVAWQATPQLLLSVQNQWYNWSEALGTLQITASQPRTAGAPAVIVLPSPVNFVDQHVIEIGMAYDYDRDNTIYAGVNHGSRPIPDSNMSPVFQPIQARHYMLGARHKFEGGWYAAGGMEYFAFQSVTYDSALFGPRANNRHIGIVFHASIGRNW